MRVKKIKLTTVKPRPKKPRRPRGELTKCYRCPPEHPGWKHSELRNRRKLPHCPAHRESHDEVNQPWPSCPRCGSPDLGIMKWGGDVLSTTIHCEDCGFSDKAIKYHDAVTIWVIAAPIESPTGA